MNRLSIRTFLMLLILAASIPLVATVGHDFFSDRQQSVGHSKIMLRTLASTMTSNTSAKIVNARHILEYLAARPLIKQVNPKNCDPTLKDMLAMVPDYANIGYANLEGLVVCSAVPTPGGKQFDVSQRSWFQKTMKEKRFSVGNPLIGQATGKLVSVLSTPIWNDRKELVGTIFLPLDLKVFDPNIPNQFLPTGSRYGFFAEDGTMIWRNLDPEGVIGTRPNADAARRIVEVRDGEFESLAIDGVTRFFSVVPMPETGWVAFIGVPAATIYAEANRQIISEATIMLVAIAFLIFLATAISRRIARPTEELARATRTVRGGDLDARMVVCGPREIAAVAQEFNDMVAELRGLEAVLRESESRFREIFNAVDDAIFIHDAKTGCIIDVNRRMCEMYGLTREEALVCDPDDLSAGTPPYSAADAAQKIHLACTDGPQTFDWLARAHDGHLFWVEVCLRIGFIGNQQRILATVRDITERKKAEEEINSLAFYDTLTNLPNRRMLNDRLGQALAISKRSGLYGALMFLDLDNFKPLNDTYGHSVGDLLLIEVAHRLTNCVREVDTVARFGGDEFVVMLSDLDENRSESATQAGIVAEKIRAALAEPYLLTFMYDGKVETVVKHHCAASIGVVVFNSEEGAENILKWADIAMYQAKDNGRNSICFYSSNT